jgi:uncharacterized phage-associated protein
MPYIVLLKLLYLADKEMLLTWGVPMTYDHWYAMKYGPVLSNTLNIIKASAAKNTSARSHEGDYWDQHIRKDGYDLELVGDPGDDLLSEAEEAIIDKVFEEHGKKDKWALVDWTHELPEWTNPGDSSYPITYDQVLRIEGRSAEAIEDLMANIKVEDELALAFAGSH